MQSQKNPYVLYRQMASLLDKREFSKLVPLVEEAFGERPRTKTAANDPLLFFAVACISDAERQLSKGFVDRVLPALLERAMDLRLGDWDREGTVIPLTAVLDRRPALRPRFLELARVILTSSKWKRSGSVWLVAATIDQANKAKDAALRDLALASWDRTLTNQLDSFLCHEPRLLWSLETLAKNGAAETARAALVERRPTLQRAARKNATLAKLLDTKAAVTLRGEPLAKAAVARLQKHPKWRKERPKSVSAKLLEGLSLAHGVPLPASLAYCLRTWGAHPFLTGAWASRSHRAQTVKALFQSLFDESLCRALNLDALERQLPGCCWSIGDYSFLYAGLPDALGEVPVLTFVEESDEVFVVVEFPGFDLWLATQVGLLGSQWIGDVVEDPTYGPALRTAAKQLGKALKRRGKQLVIPIRDR